MQIYISAPHSNWCNDAMKLYLAGRASRPFVLEFMKVYLASPNTGSIKRHLQEMKTYLALANSAGTYPRSSGDLKQKIYVLESFYYVQDWMLPYIKDHWNFMLDSGAFTFMENSKKTENWDEYVERYAKFINDNDIELFFELDIDSVVGIKEVERLRDKLETLTNKQCIPVWHKSRGKDYWLRMAKEYNYIAIGGIVSGEIKKHQYPHFKTLISLAHEHDALVHGLGFTNLKGLTQYKFDSVDSTAWIYGNRSGFVQWFDGKTLQKIQAKPGMKMKSKETAIHNFNEWVKFQRYADKNL